MSHESSEPERVNFAGNDYLGLARDPRLAEALAVAARQHGISATSSRWGLGWTEVHERLEQELAQFLGVEAACILGAAYFGGPVYFSEMAAESPVVYCDEFSHSNLFFGVRAAGLELRTYRHLDAGHLEQLLAAHSGAPPLLVTDGVFGISGELAPLAEIRDLAQRHGAELLVDDAHGLFALGETGRGSAELCGLQPGEFTLLGSMSKALGVNGGILAGRRALVERFRRSTPASGSAIPPVPIAAACRESLRIAHAETDLRARLANNHRRMLQAIAKAGLMVVEDRTAILALDLADEVEARHLDAHLLAHGLRVPYFKYASEPRENLLRSVARACYGEAELQRFETAIQSWQPPA